MVKKSNFIWISKSVFISIFIIFMFKTMVFAESFELCPGFSYQDISEEVQENMNGKSYKENKHIKIEDLRVCEVKCIGFDGEEHNGKLVVASKATNPKTGKSENVAKEILEIFKEIYDKKFPIKKMRMIDHYGGNDESSMKDNNSSAFNFRYIKNTNRISLHSYGLAIDINPFVNPCYHPTSKDVEPKGAEKFLDRTLDQLGLIKKGDPCYTAFKSRGWIWGGEWANPIDYMHFQKYPQYSAMTN